MRVDEFDYEMPRELIALHPADRRDRSRMMLVDRAAGAIGHRRFLDFPGCLDPGDLLVVNDSRVFPARLSGTRQTGGRVEILFVEKLADGDAGPPDRELWRAMVRPAKRLREGEAIATEGGLECRIVHVEGEGFFRLSAKGSIAAHLEAHGHVPLPPYIASRRPEAPEDRERYQTVYAEAAGSCAAPTAGLHLTDSVLEELREREVRVQPVTLHVGPATFLPVRTGEVEEHRMHEEAYEVPERTIDALRETRERGGRVVACGTTAVRALEAWAQTGARKGRTDLFIRPGFVFRAVDAMLTNFHLPRSTLLMLVGAFMGADLMRETYRLAVERRYRFYSYGDCMLIL